MRVLQVIADGSPGGGTSHVLQLVTGLSRRASFSLVTQRDSYLIREGAKSGLPTFGVEFFRSRVDLRVPIRIRRIVEDLGPDIIHAHGGRAAFFCALARVQPRMVYTVHGYHFVDKPFWLRPLAMRAERAASERSARVVFVCDHDSGLAKRYGLVREGTATSVIRCGVPMSEIPRAEAPSLRHVGFIGRLERQKDPLLFVDVLARLPDFTATIVGDGRLDGRLRASIAARELPAQLLGALPRSRSLQVLSTLGVLVMTSRWEGLPVLALEAMWAGVPVVATDVGGVREAIEDGRTGVVVRTRAPDEIAGAVRRVTEDLEFRELIIKNARDRVQRLFSGDQMLAEIEAVYQQVARG